ncbi:MAG: hypothetical protein ACPLSP_04460, partial [Fervidicoccus fontis]
MRELVEKLSIEASEMLIVASEGEVKFYVDGKECGRVGYEDLFEVLSQLTDFFFEKEEKGELRCNIKDMGDRALILFCWRGNEKLTFEKKKSRLEWINRILKENNIELSDETLADLAGMPVSIPIPPTEEILESPLILGAPSLGTMEVKALQEFRVAIEGDPEFLDLISKNWPAIHKKIDSLKKDFRNVKLIWKDTFRQSDVVVTPEEVWLIMDNLEIIDSLGMFASKLIKEYPDISDMVNQVLNIISEKLPKDEETIKRASKYTLFLFGSALKEYVLTKNREETWAQEILREAPAGLKVGNVVSARLDIIGVAIDNLWRFP